MTSVNVTTQNNTVTVQEGDATTVTVTTQGPQGATGAGISAGDKGSLTVAANLTDWTLNDSVVTSAKITDGAILNADINASAAIELSKLATGALPTAITVTSANISDLSIVDADISGSAAISLSKLATGALPTAITVTSANISDLSIVNADINASAAIAQSKLDIADATTSASGFMSGSDKTKLDGIETNADVTDATNVDAAGAVMNSDSTTASMGFVVDEDNMSSNSSTKVPTQQSVKAYVDTEVADNIATKMSLSGGTFTGDVTFTGDSSNIVFDKSDNALEFADNAKLTFGDLPDVNMRHDGVRTILRNHGIGPLVFDLLVSGNSFSITKANLSETIAVFIPDGAVELYFDNVKKLETTSSGITVQGSVTTEDMNMSNLNGTANEVDSTKGSWSIQEGADDLFIINRVSGKKYKFNLTEIS